MARRRSKPTPRASDQEELNFKEPAATTKPPRMSTDTEKAARLAIARRAQPAGTNDTVRLTVTIYLSRRQAERLAARAIRGEKNLEALLSEILEAAATDVR